MIGMTKQKHTRSVPYTRWCIKHLDYFKTWRYFGTVCKRCKKKALIARFGKIPKRPKKLNTKTVFKKTIEWRLSV